MKSIGQLIDELSIVNVKTFFLVDVISNETDDVKVAEAARKAQKLNSQRAALVNEIDERLEGKGNIIKV